MRTTHFSFLPNKVKAHISFLKKKYILAPHIFAEHSVKEFRFFFFEKVDDVLRTLI